MEQTNWVSFQLASKWLYMRTRVSSWNTPNKCQRSDASQTTSESRNAPSTSRDVKPLCERRCHKRGISVQESQMLFLNKKFCKLLFSRKDDQVSDCKFPIWQVQSSFDSEETMLVKEWSKLPNPGIMGEFLSSLQRGNLMWELHFFRKIPPRYSPFP